jgi:hypothetical protein
MADGFKVLRVDGRKVLYIDTDEGVVLTEVSGQARRMRS